MTRRLHGALLELIGVLGYTKDEKIDELNLMIGFLNFLRESPSTREKEIDKPILGGVCHGFDIKWFEAEFLDEGAILEKRIEILRADETIPTIIQHINDYKIKAKQKDDSKDEPYWPNILGFLDELGEQACYWLETLGFFDSLMLFHDPEKFDAVLNNARHRQTNVAPISTLASSEAMRKLGGLATLSSRIGLYTQDELVAYIHDLAQIIDDLGSEAPKKMGFLLHSKNHATGLMYHSGTKHWTFMDINQWPPMVHQADDLEAMSVSIMKGFNARNRAAKEVCFATYPIAPKHVLDRIPQLTEKLAQQCPPQSVTADMIQRKEFPNFMHIACQCDKPEVIKAAHGTYDLNSTVESGLSLLQVACICNSLKVIDALHECGVDFEQCQKDGSRAIDTAACSSSPETLRALIRYSSQSTPAENGVLPRKAAEINNARAIGVFKEFQIDLNQQDEWGNTALHVAVYENHLETVDALIGNAADLNIQDKLGETPLHVAVRRGHTQCAMLLIQAGARLDLADKEGNLPLHTAVTYTRFSIFLELLPEKIGLNAQNKKGQTPLSIATTQFGSNKDPLMIKSLLAYDADLNLPNLKGETPLILAVSRTYDPLISLFLQQGADVNCVDNEGNSALLIAAADTDDGCITRLRLLLSFRANAALVNTQGQTAVIIAIRHYNRRDSIQKLNELLKYDVDLFQVSTAGEMAFSLAREQRDWAIFNRLMTYQCQKIAILLGHAFNQNNIKLILAVLLVIGVVYASQKVNQKNNEFSFFCDEPSTDNISASVQDAMTHKK